MLSIKKSAGQRTKPQYAENGFDRDRIIFDMIPAAIFFTVLVSAISTFEFVKTIMEMKRERQVMKAIKAEAGGFGV
ncbi:MAG: hypothetical protein QHC90_03790 [Shinella sp.]|nr:hypothetical protein [Shinella sp.]